LNKKQKIYFSEEILQMINKLANEYIEEKDFLKTNDYKYYGIKLIQKIIKELYEEFIQINNTEKILHKSSSALQINTLKKSLSFKDIKINEKLNTFQITKNEALTYLFNSIQFNKNINPSDITIDLNDERKAVKDKNNNQKGNELINRDSSKPSIRLSDLLTEIISVRPSNETNKKNKIIMNPPFPKDSNAIEYINTNESLNSEENKIVYEEMSIGTKIKKKYCNNYKKVKNNNDIRIQKTTSGESSLLRFLIDDKNTIENINKNDKSDKLLNKIIDK
jgi:hypothetical protein